MELIRTLEHPVVIYEAPARVAETLADIAALGDPDRPVAVARELTKRFEDVGRGTVAALAAYYRESPPRGEVVMIVDRAAAKAISEDTLRSLVARFRAEGASARDVVTSLVAEGASRNVAYRLAHEP
jgi:16S rRNA (cytidine1402-2'-O)-methyltransferase